VRAGNYIGLRGNMQDADRMTVDQSATVSPLPTMTSTGLSGFPRFFLPFAGNG
jgi:hypothetical protein